MLALVTHLRLMKGEYFVHRNGSEEGPYTKTELLDRRAQGNVPQGCYVWTDGMVEWKPLYQVFPARPFSAPPAPPGSSEAVSGSWWKRSLSIGEVSFVLGASSFLIFFLMALLPRDSAGMIMAVISGVVGIMAMGAAFAVLIAIVTGIVSLCRREGRVVFPILGIVLSVLALALKGDYRQPRAPGCQITNEGGVGGSISCGDYGSLEEAAIIGIFLPSMSFKVFSDPRSRERTFLCLFDLSETNQLARLKRLRV